MLKTPWYTRSSNYLSIDFEGQTAETFAETKPAPTLLLYPTPQKQYTIYGIHVLKMPTGMQSLHVHVYTHT